MKLPILDIDIQLYNKNMKLLKGKIMIKKLINHQYHQQD